MNVLNCKKEYNAYPEVVVREYVLLKIDKVERKVYLDTVKSKMALLALRPLPRVCEGTVRLYNFKGTGPIEEKVFEGDDMEAVRAQCHDLVEDLMSAYKKTDEEKKADRETALKNRQVVIDESGLTEEEAIALGIVAPQEEV